MALQFNPFTGTFDVTTKGDTGAVAAAGDGTAALPGITFASENIGLFRSGASTLGLSTGGLERLRITSTGQLSHIGAGTSGSPAVSFSGSAASNSLVVDSSSRVGVGTSTPRGLTSISNNTAGSVVDSSLHFGYSTSDFYGFRIVNSSDPASTSAGLFKIQRGTTSAWADAVTVNNAGLVGIGTTSPQNQLVVSNGGAAGIEISSTSFSGNPLIASYNRSGAAYTQLTLDGATTVFAISGSERGRWDSSGRFLVGTASARSTLSFASVAPSIQVAGNTTSSSSLLLHKFGADANACKLIFLKNRGANADSNGGLSVDDPLGVISFEATDGFGGSTLIGAEIGAYAEAGHGSANDDGPTRLVFSTTADGAASPTERMRITSGGAMRLNTTTGTVGTTAFGTVFASDGAGSFRTSRNVNGVDHVAIVSGNVGLFVVRGDGDCENTNNSYGALSDVKLKENIVNASSQWNDISALQVRNYNFKTETGYRTHTQIGLVAQEVELVSPGLVSESPDRDEEGNDLGTVTKSVNYSVLYMKAVKALQEAMERIETLEAKVAALEGS